MLTTFASGAFLGLSCGLAPGPLMALLLAQTLRHGPREGCKVALTPLATDLPIIVVALVVAAKVSDLHTLLGVVSAAGGSFLLYLAWDSFTPAALDPNAPPASPRSVFRGIVTNALSPHPWFFWLTVGAAILAKAIAQSWLNAVAFLLGFYVLLVGSKAIVAILAGRSRNLLAGRPYKIIMRVLAALLAIFGLLLFGEAYRLFQKSI